MREFRADSFRIGRIFVLGLGYLTINIVWSLYNSYLPVFYGEFIASNMLIGLIMTLDNFAAISLQPYFAALSDRTNTRIGRRMPFLLVGMPITAIFFVLIPHARALLPLLVVTLLMNIGISIFNSPTLALMPDITPSEQRSKANGVINFMGGLGALLAFFVGSRMYKANTASPFIATSVLMLITLVILFFAIRERRLSLLYRGQTADAHRAADEEVGLGDIGGLLEAIRELFRRADKSPLYLLAGCFAWVAAVNGAQNMFTRYGVHHMGIDAADSSFILGFFALAFIVFAIPAGYVAGRFGRMRTIKAGITGTLATFGLLTLVPDPGLAKVFFLVGGVSWALIITNAYPTLMDLTPLERAGAYTGLWNMAIALAGLTSPPIYGWVVDLLGYGAFFYAGIVFLVAALLLVQRVAPLAPEKA